MYLSHTNAAPPIQINRFYLAYRAVRFLRTHRNPIFYIPIASRFPHPMVLFTTVIAFIALLMFASPATAKCADKEGARGHIEIKAPARIVWDAVHKERAEDPDLSYSKVVEKQGDKVMLEQKFKGMPVIGEAVCLMEQTETLNQRIDYKMVSSDKFKALRGSWILTELANGNTKLELHSVLNTGLPFSEHIINHVLKGRIAKRLERVKESAERLLEAEAKSAVPATGPKPTLAGKQQFGVD